MSRKRLTEAFPALLPLRQKQRRFCFYAAMTLSRQRFAAQLQAHNLPFMLVRGASPLLNYDTGADMQYQYNKIHNLKLVAAVMDGVLIRPGESFSFWRLARHADRHIPYQDGLTYVNGRLTAAPGGGICQISNLLHWLFLHTPLTVSERHGHGRQDFPQAQSDAVQGVDATVAEGWLDLRMYNNTYNTYQIRLRVTEDELQGEILCERRPEFYYCVENGDIRYVRTAAGAIDQEAAVIRRRIAAESGEEQGIEQLYRNRCRITYALPEDVLIEREGVWEDEQAQSGYSFRRLFGRI